MGRNLVLLMCCLVLPVREARAYSVLTHEAIIDAAWDDSIVPLLRARFRPSADEMLRARAFAYGGCLIQDLGYYPFSSRLFGDLTHYVRSGDFIEALVREARNTEELAFALGALAHYAADNVGHPAAVNLAVPITYPKLRTKFGDRVTYQDNPTAHLRTEFGFDVLQIARGRYLPDAYRDFIGFEVSKPVLERAFTSTYGLELDDVFTNFGLAIGTFRWTVSTTIPEMTKVAWESRYDEIAAQAPGTTRQQFLFSLSRAEYEQRWGTEYKRPNFWHRLCAALLRIVPKIGPFKTLAFKPLTPEAERLFVDSFTATVQRYRGFVAAALRNRLRLENRNFDTGRPVRAGDYRLADEAYARLLEKLADEDFKGVSPRLRGDILAFYSTPEPVPTSKGDRKQLQKIRADLDDLRRTGTQQP
jgi:Zinc dependent phospholipase C